MNTTPTETLSSTYLGRFQNGVVVLYTRNTLNEGQVVRIEPLDEIAPGKMSAERIEQLRRMKSLFEQWDAEDHQLSDEEAECLQIALQQSRGMALRMNPVL